jgi:hypothetical protein
MHNTTAADFATHRAACQAIPGGDLVSFNSFQEQAVVEKSLRITTDYNSWIGVLQAGTNWYLLGEHPGAIPGLCLTCAALGERRTLLHMTHGIRGGGWGGKWRWRWGHTYLPMRTHGVHCTAAVSMCNGLNIHCCFLPHLDLTSDGTYVGTGYPSDANPYAHWWACKLSPSSCSSSPSSLWMMAGFPAALNMALPPSWAPTNCLYISGTPAMCTLLHPVSGRGINTAPTLVTRATLSSWAITRTTSPMGLLL